MGPEMPCMGPGFVRQGAVDMRFLNAVVAAGLLGWLGMSFGTTSAEPTETVVAPHHADSHRLGAEVSYEVDLPLWNDRMPPRDEPVLVFTLLGE